MDRKVYLKIWKRNNKQKVQQHEKTRRQKAARKAYVKKYRIKYEAEHKEQRKGYVKKWYFKAKEKKLKEYLIQLRYERKHPDRCKIYYEKNKEKILAQQKAHRKLSRIEGKSE